MLINLIKKNLHWIVYLVGLVFYPIIISNSIASLGVIWLMFLLYLWLIISMIIKEYVFKDFLYLLCISGVIVAISLFFINGIEEIPFPEGAILFKLEGVIQALALFFVFTAPLIIYNNKTIFIPFQSSPPPKKPNKKHKSNKTDYNESWEEATIEDLETGKYEII